MLTKQNEIEILRATVAQLGPDSYCGPWLSQCLPSIQSDILADYSPLVDWNQTRTDCERMREEAKAQVDEMLKRANQEAERIMADAFKRADSIREHVASVLRKSLREIES